jgi:RNA polymerase sigma factor (TIGR02999 family)
MTDPSDYKKKIDELLKAISGGDSEAMNELIPLIYDELRWLAHSKLKVHSESQTLRTTELVNEAYINMVSRRSQDWKNRAYFFCAAANLMRQILIQHMRNKERLKRGGGHEQEDLNVEDLLDTKDTELLQIHEALNDLERVDKTLAQIVVNRYFGGLTIEETAQVMNLSPATVKRKWEHAKAWLSRELKR